MTEQADLKKQMLFSIRYTQELDKELVFSHQKLEKFMVDFPLNKYGSGVLAVRFTFVCLIVTKQNHEEKTTFLKKCKELYIVRKLDYETFSKLTLEDAIKMQAQVFLQALASVRKRKKPIPDFDFERFYADVEKLFREKKWIEDEKTE